MVIKMVLEKKDIENIRKQYRELYERGEADMWLDDLMREIHDDLGYGFVAEGFNYVWCDGNKFLKFWAKDGDIVIEEISEDEYFTEQFVEDIEEYICEKESIRWLLRNTYKITERD